MSKKKHESMNAKMFDKRADIVTEDGTIYRIRKIRLYNLKTNYYGKVYVITSSKYNKRNLHIIREFYETDQTTRIHVRLDNLTNVKMIKSTEKTPDGKERKILVIEDYDNLTEYVHSIGTIKEIKSDINNNIKNHLIDNYFYQKNILIE